MKGQTNCSTWPPRLGLGEGPTIPPWKTRHTTETASTFQGLYGTEEEIGQVPQDCDIVFTDYQSLRTSDGESHCEARKQTESLLKLKDLIIISIWNVRTMYAIGNAAKELNAELQSWHLRPGISQCRWKKRERYGGFWATFSGCPEIITVPQNSPGPMGKRKVGRPKTTWCRTAEKESTMADWKSWEEARALAKDRSKWKSSVALCATEREEDRWGEVTYMKMNIRTRSSQRNSLSW